MLRAFAIAAGFAACATVVFAASPSIDQRQAVFKAFGGAMKSTGGMLKGEAPFDLTKVQIALRTLAEGSLKQKDLFPDDSKSGGDTEALPKIWEKKADFLARFDKLSADATAAMSAIKDEASFKAEWPKIGANCGGCHREYKAP